MSSGDVDRAKAEISDLLAGRPTSEQQPKLRRLRLRAVGTAQQLAARKAGAQHAEQHGGRWRGLHADAAGVLQPKYHGTTATHGGHGDALRLAFRDFELHLLLPAGMAACVTRARRPPRRRSSSTTPTRCAATSSARSATPPPANTTDILRSRRTQFSSTPCCARTRRSIPTTRRASCSASCATCSPRAGRACASSTGRPTPIWSSGWFGTSLSAPSSRRSRRWRGKRRRARCGRRAPSTRRCSRSCSSRRAGRSAAAAFPVFLIDDPHQPTEYGSR